MQVAIFFVLTVLVCFGLGFLQMVFHVKLPIWASYALGAVIAAPLINWISHVIDRKYKEKHAPKPTSR